MSSEPSELAASMADQIPTDLNEPAETPPNVVPFPSMGGEPRSSASLTPAESNAFNELARQLSARLEREYAADPGSDEVAEPPTMESPEPRIEQPANKQPEWMIASERPALGENRRDRTLLDLLPTGILIYRFDHLLYANPAFLERMGYLSLHALNQAGGLGALYVEQGVSSTSSTSEAGTPVTIATERACPTDARLFTISWDGDPALALMFTPEQSAPVSSAPVPASTLKNPPLPTRKAKAEDLAAILDTTAEGILMFDASGEIHGCNRSAVALFGYDRVELEKRNLVELFARESQRAVLEYLGRTQIAANNSPPDAGCDVLGRTSHGAIIPLSMTMGRTRPDGPNFFAVFRDQPQGKMGDRDLRDALRTAERAAGARAAMLARISDHVRTPLKAIIGLAEVMMSERFGPLGNERYVEHLKDIRASGERVIAIINDLTELSRIQSGKLDLAFANQNLNELVESCVSVMQPQANRERIIIRTSLAHLLPPVVADAPSLRQITMNLIGNSILLANPGDQVIVSTALSDHGDVVLRVRDGGSALNGQDVAAALGPLRTPPPSDKASDASPINLSLTKALVEANRAQFHLKTAGRSGTLVEVVFVRA
jgi:PAS domain S-box-containing protein